MNRAQRKEPIVTSAVQPNEAGDFFGRKKEIEELQRLVSAAESGSGRIVLVEGEAGIGKTRLLKQFAELRQKDGAQLFWGRCSEDASAPAFWPWLQIIRSFLKDSCGKPITETSQFGLLLGDSGEIADKKALAQYASRSRDLKAELEDAKANNDLGAVDKIGAELEWLRRTISNATGIGRSVRLAGSAAERARVSVRNNLSAVFRRVKESDRTIGMHFEQSVRTGHSCAYRPAQPVTWLIES